MNPLAVKLLDNRLYTYYRCFSYPPKDLNCDAYLNRGNRSLLLAVEAAISPVFAVERLCYILEKKKHQIIIILEPMVKDQIIHCFQNSSVKDRVSF